MVLELVIYRYGIPKFMPGMASAAASLLFGGIVIFIFFLLGFQKEIRAGGQ